MMITATLVVRRQFVRAAAVHFYAANMQYSRSAEMAQVVGCFSDEFYPASATACGRASSDAANPQAAANDNHSPGIAGLLVT